MKSGISKNPRIQGLLGRAIRRDRITELEKIVIDFRNNRMREKEEVYFYDIPYIPPVPLI